MPHLHGSGTPWQCILGKKCFLIPNLVFLCLKQGEGWDSCSLYGASLVMCYQHAEHNWVTEDETLTVGRDVLHVNFHPDSRIPCLKKKTDEGIKKEEWSTAKPRRKGRRDAVKWEEVCNTQQGDKMGAGMKLHLEDFIHFSLACNKCCVQEVVLNWNDLKVLSLNKALPFSFYPAVSLVVRLQLLLVAFFAGSAVSFGIGPCSAVCLFLFLFFPEVCVLGEGKSTAWKRPLLCRNVKKH